MSRETIWEQMADNKNFVGKTLVELSSGEETEIVDVTYEDDYFSIRGKDWDFGAKNGPNAAGLGMVGAGEDCEIRFKTIFGWYGVKSLDES